MKLSLGIAIVVALLLGGIWWSSDRTERDPDVVARNGLHAHPELAIYVKGVRQEIPANIGIGVEYSSISGFDQSMQMAPIHTHEDLPLIHLEFAGGVVRRGDITLGQFFRVWGRDMRGFGADMRMTVNGVENTEYENYVMEDKDRIELRFN